MDTGSALVRMMRRAHDGTAEIGSQWFWESDADLNLVYVSADASAVSGIPRARLASRTLRDLVQEFEPLGRRRATSALKNLAPFDETFRHPESGSGSGNLRLVGIPMFDEAGNFAGYRGTGSSGSHPMGSLVRMLADAIESQAIGFTLYDADHRLAFWNSAFAVIYPEIERTLEIGAPFENVADKLLGHAAAEDAGKGADCPRNTARYRKGENTTLELRLNNGRWVLINSQRIRSGGIVCLHTDITERKAAEVELTQSFDLFSTAFQFNPGTTAIADIEDGRLIAVNERWLAAFGWTEEEVIGKSVLELGIWADPTDRLRFIETLKANGRVRNFQTRHCGRDGRAMDVLAEGELITLGGKRRLLIAGHDITERKKTEDALRRSEARLSGILEITPEAIILLDQSMRITSFNGGAERTFGYQAPEAMGKDMDFLVPAEERESFDAQIKGFARSEQATRFIGQQGLFSGLRKNGTRFLAEGMVSRMKVESETLFVVLLRDVTSRHEAEQALRTAKEEAEFSNRAKSEFLANMSHELRTPLNAILGFSQVIRDGMLGPLENRKYAEYAKDIHDSGKLLLDIISDILDLSKIDSGHAALDEEDVNLHSLLESCMTLMRERAQTAGVKLSARYDEALPAIHGDRRRIKQIAINLLSNAIKFTPIGGNVLLDGSKGADGGFVLAVADTGIGIKARDIPRVFEPFSQLEQSLTRGHEGTGLGLPLVKKLSEMHGAMVEMRSQPGHGTTVEVRFPPERSI